MWQATPPCLLWRARNWIAFRNEVLSIQKLKYSFVSLLCSETKLPIVYGPSTLVAFIDWFGCQWG